MNSRLVLKTAMALSIFAFCCALVGLFAFGNYLMVGGHRPPHEVLANGFTFPILGKGATVYISKIDLICLTGLLSLLVASMISANWAHKKIG
jgi:hypothetical protein